MGDYRTLLVPYDFSPHSRAALDAAVDLARRLGSDVHLLHVVEIPVFAYGYGGAAGPIVPPSFNMAEIRARAMDSLHDVVDGIANRPGKLEPHVVEGISVADVIQDTAKQLGADLIVMGTHGRTGLAHVFLGSVAERTLRSAPCPVLTVHASEDDEER